jgi:hypothetical protein
MEAAATPAIRRRFDVRLPGQRRFVIVTTWNEASGIRYSRRRDGVCRNGQTQNQRTSMSGSLTSVKRKQGWMFASGVGVAAVPIAVQVIAALVIWNDTNPKAFPMADDAIDSKAF